MQNLDFFEKRHFLNKKSKQKVFACILSAELNYSRIINLSGMGVYSLSEISYLSHDLKDILRRIDTFYSINFRISGTIYYPKRLLDNSKHWASTESIQMFNDFMPEVKSLHKDMYAAIESISKAKHGEFKLGLFEARYSNFKEFRLLNNKLKHFNNGSVEIDVVQIIVMESQQQLVDLYCTFRSSKDFKTFLYSEFVETFLCIMDELGAIKIQRSDNFLLQKILLE